MKVILAVLYVMEVCSASLAGSLYFRTQSASTDRGSEHAERQVPYATLLVALAIAIPTTLQFFFPAILQTLERDYTKILVGQWWRIVTSLFVQDGGVSGSIFNLVTLLLVGMIAEKSWGSRRWLILFFGGGILSQFAGFVWQPVGAGNSVANFSLVGGIAVWCLASKNPRAIQVLCSFALAIGAILSFLRNIHGPAVLVGTAIALLFLQVDYHAFKKPP